MPYDVDELRGRVKALVTEAELPELDEAKQKDYQYMDSWDYASRAYSQAEAGYNAAGGAEGKACSNCRFFVSPARCSIVSGDIAPNGVSQKWEAVPTYEAQPIPVVIVGKDSKPSLLSRIKAYLPFAPSPDEQAERDVTAIQLWRQKDGRYRWYTRYSNSWLDQDDELILEASHKEYAEWANETKQYPELWLWHTPGSRFGEADWVDFSGGFAHASGLIDKGKESVVAFLQTKSVGVSHGFLCTPSQKYIEKHRTFEISVLPLNRAAAWGTDFNILANKEQLVKFTKDRREFLVGALGEEAVATLENDADATAQGLKALGVEYKATGMEEPEPVKPAETEPAPAEIVTKELVGQLGDIMTAVKSLTDVVQKQASAITALQKSDDDKIAEAFTARVAGAAGARPTEQAANVVTKEAGQPVEDFMTKMIAGTLGAQLAGMPQAGTAAVSVTPQSTVTT